MNNTSPWVVHASCKNTCRYNQVYNQASICIYLAANMCSNRFCNLKKLYNNAMEKILQVLTQVDVMNNTSPWVVFAIF
jgi:hypothetical protein